MRSVRHLIIALVIAPVALRAQSARLDSALVTSIATMLAARLDSAARYPAANKEPTPILIVDSGYTPAERTILDAAILAAARTRRSTPADDKLHRIVVDLPRFDGDTAIVHIADGWFACGNGSEVAGGEGYDDLFMRNERAWHYMGRREIIEYDPAPPPAPGASPRGCPSFGRPRGGQPRGFPRTLADTLEALERSSWVAWQARDSTFFSHFLTTDHVDVGVTGRMSRRAVLAGVASSACVVRSYAVDYFRTTRLDAHTAILTYLAEQDTRCNGVAVPSPAWATSVYVWRDGSWQNALYQQTPAAPATSLHTPP